MTSQPVGLSSDLAPRQVMRATVGQHDMAIWRSVSGVISAWDNRCPHRGMRLSHGFVRGESLACAYHGWHYSCAGYCNYIPAHPELTPPKTVRPVIYSVVEQAGIIWVNPVDDAYAVELPSDSQAVRSLTLACDLDTALQALAAVPQSSSVLKATTANLVAESLPELKTISETPRVVSVNSNELEGGIIIALQQANLHTVIAHVLVHESVTTEETITLCRWLESVRRHAESSTGEAG